MHTIINDVWDLESPDEKVTSDILSGYCSVALDGNKVNQQFLRGLWDNESWESIKKKLETEGSVWYVWWMDGVRKIDNMRGEQESK